MTAVPPPVPPEYVRRAAESLNRTHWNGEGCGTHGTSACSHCYGPSPADADEVAETVLDEVYGDIVEAARRDALESAMEGNALARAVGWDDGYLRGRRDALTEAAEAINDEALRVSRTSAIRAVQIRSAVRIITDLRDAT